MAILKKICANRTNYFDVSCFEGFDDLFQSDSGRQDFKIFSKFEVSSYEKTRMKDFIHFNAPVISTTDSLAKICHRLKAKAADQSERVSNKITQEGSQGPNAQLLHGEERSISVPK